MLRTKEYYELLESLGFASREELDSETQKRVNDYYAKNKKYPVDVVQGTSMRIREKELTDEEFKRLGILKILREIKTIKNCAIFFVALTVISLVLSIVALLL